MCGRFVAAAPPEELVRYFGARLDGESLEPNYNVAPTTEIYAVRAQATEPSADTEPSAITEPSADTEPAQSDVHRTLSTLRWGLIPFWAKESKIGSRMINARSETAATNGAFRRPMASRRCLIPASAFYEWQKIAGSKTKQPYAIDRADDELLVFAGLWDRWRHGDQADGQVTESCTILTTTPNAEMAAIHDRMPVMVPPHSFDRWIDPEVGADDVVDLLVPAPDGFLRLTPVSTLVNRVGNNGPELLTPVEMPGQTSGQLSLDEGAS